MPENELTLRLLTYNIHKGIGGVDRQYRLERTIETIRHCSPDICFLQEVDEGVPRSNGHCQVELLAEALGMRYSAYQPNVRLKTGHYGNAILSHHSLADIRHIDLTVPLKKRRRALVVHCRLRHNGKSRTILLINVHLGLAGFERMIQMQRVLRSDVLTHAHWTTAALIAGDYNDVWGTLGRRVLEPAGYVAACGRRKTFPAMLPVRSLDRVFYRGDILVRGSFASRTEVARQASDHLPLVVDVSLEIPDATGHTTDELMATAGPDGVPTA